MMNDEAWSCAFWGIKVLLINSERLARSENFTIRSIPPRIRIKTVANRALHTWGRFDFETSDVNQPLPSTCLWVVALQVWRQDTHTHTHLKSFKQNYHELSVSALGQAECMERASTCFAHIWSPNSPSFFGSGGPCQCGVAKSCHVFPNFDNSLTTSLCWTSIVSPFMDHTRLRMQFRLFQKQTHRHIVWTENYKYV